MWRRVGEHGSEWAGSRWRGGVVLRSLRMREVGKAVSLVAWLMSDGDVLAVDAVVVVVAEVEH